MEQENTQQMKGWIRTANLFPVEGVVVDTMINDGRCARNLQCLKRLGALWFFPEGDMYVYYTPTHWKPRAGKDKP